MGSSDFFTAGFFKFTLIIPVDYSNEFFPSDRYSDLPNLTFIIFEKYFPFLNWRIINTSHSLCWVFMLENAKILADS